MNQERRQHGLQQTEDTTQKKGEWDTYDNDNFTLEEEDKRKHPSLNIWTSGTECGVASTAQEKKSKTGKRQVLTTRNIIQIKYVRTKSNQFTT